MTAPMLSLDQPEPPAAGRPAAAAGGGWLIALVGWTALVASFDLRGGAGFEPTDCWVAQTAREMSESGDWRGYVLPRFCGEMRMQKSPGPYWAVCLTSWLRGTAVDEVSVRIPNALFAVVLVVTCWWLTAQIAGSRAGVFAGFAAASSVFVLYWSHRGASDLGVAALMAVSLASFWIGSERCAPGGRQRALWLLAYFAAGLAMLYKMPMPLVCIGLPAAAYIVLCNRWRILASGWHLAGVLVFLLPWLPWALAVLQLEPTAVYKWRVEYWDRMTGELPTTGEESGWQLYLLYLGVALVFSFPYTLSVPGALLRAFRRQAGVERCGAWFLLIWFASLLAFFTASGGKETRYFLPAMPPLLMMLGIELSAFFDPARRASARLDRLGVWLVAVLVPAAFIAAGTAVYYAGLHVELGFAWSAFWPPFAALAGVFWVGAIVAANLYARRRESASFGALVATMWACFAIGWSGLAPCVASEAAMIDFGRQLRDRLTDDQKAALRQVAQQDPRIIWYGDVRFPRVVDQLDLLRMQGGRRDAAVEARLIGDAIIQRLESEELALFVAHPALYVRFQLDARRELAEAGRKMPATYVWLTGRVGRWDERFVLFGNRRPPWPEPQVMLPGKIRARLEAAMAGDGAGSAAASAPAAADGAPVESAAARGE